MLSKVRVSSVMCSSYKIRQVPFSRQGLSLYLFEIFRALYLFLDKWIPQHFFAYLQKSGAITSAALDALRQTPVLLSFPQRFKKN